MLSLPQVEQLYRATLALFCSFDQTRSSDRKRQVTDLTDRDLSIAVLAVSVALAPTPGRGDVVELSIRLAMTTGLDTRMLDSSTGTHVIPLGVKVRITQLL